MCNKHMEVEGKNRSGMPFDVLGNTRATMTKTTSFLKAKQWLQDGFEGPCGFQDFDCFLRLLFTTYQKWLVNLFNFRRDGDR